MSGESSTGLDPRLAGLLCYLGTLLTGVVFLLIEKEDRSVRFHAFQSVGTFGFLLAVSAVAGWIPVVGKLAAALVGPVTVILWIVLMVKAWQGQRWKLPVVGDWAEAQAGRPAPR